jgi:hypothetical protein
MSGIRAIDNGTRYDITGNLRRLTRDIENGEISPRDVVIVATETTEMNKSATIILRHYGNGTIEDIHWMLSTAKNRIEPS